MPIVDPEKRKEYDRKRYELRLLKAGVPPRIRSKIDIELQQARANFHKKQDAEPVNATRYGGRFAIGTPLIIEDEPDYTEDVDEDDYDPENYDTTRFREFIDITKEELIEIEQELETFTEDEKKRRNRRQIGWHDQGQNSRRQI